MADIPRLIDQMQAAGVPAEGILIAVRALAEQDERRRAEARGRKAKQRISQDNSHGTVSGSSQDVPAAKVPALAPKETSPEPPKEITPNPTHQTERENGRERSDFPKNAFESHFWPLYPRKVSKGEARKVFDRIEKDGVVRFVDLMEGVTRFARSPPEMQFTPHASTWLNAEGWTDEPADRNPRLQPKFSPNGARSGVDTLIAAGLRRVDSLRSDGRPPPRGDEDDGLFAAKFGGSR